MNDYINATSIEAAFDDVINNATHIAVCPSTVITAGYPTYALVNANKLSDFVAVTSADFSKSVIDGDTELWLLARVFSNAEITGTGDMRCIAVVDSSSPGSEVVKALFAMTTFAVSSGVGFYIPTVRMPVTAVTAV